MPTPRRFVAVACAITALLSCGAEAARAQTADDLFDRDTVHDIRLFINSRDLAQLRARYLENTYYVADLQWRNIRVRNVAVRSRGVGSRNPTKLHLRVDFNRYTTGQQFLGLKALVLDNLWQHGSMVADSTAMAFFNRVGYPAPRQSFGRVYINNVYQGLYAIVESVNTDFVERTTGERNAYLFSYQYHGPFYGEYLGDDFARYKALFEAVSHEREADTILYSPIRDLFKEVNQPLDAVWRDRVEQHIDLGQYVTHAAIENFLAEDDGLLGTSGTNNFYLFRPEGSTRHRLVPWDKDSAFLTPEFPIMHRAEQYVLFQRAMEYEDLRALYLQVLEHCALAAAEDDWLEAEIVRAASLVDTAVREDTRKQFSNEQFDEAVALLREFARARSAFVLQEVAQHRQHR